MIITGRWRVTTKQSAWGTQVRRATEAKPRSAGGAYRPEVGVGRNDGTDHPGAGRSMPCNREADLPPKRGVVQAATRPRRNWVGRRVARARTEPRELAPGAVHSTRQSCPNPSGTRDGRRWQFVRFREARRLRQARTIDGARGIDRGDRRPRHPTRRAVPPRDRMAGGRPGISRHPAKKRDAPAGGRFEG